MRKTVLPAPRAQVGDVGPEVGARLRVETGRRLVEEDELRVVHETHRDVEPAALAAGHRLRLAGPHALEVELVEELLARALGLGGADAVEQAVVDDLLTGARVAAVEPLCET